MLGGEIANTPYSRRQQRQLPDAPHIGMIGMHELDMLGEDSRRNRPVVGCQRVLRRNHLDSSYRQ